MENLKDWRKLLTHAGFQLPHHLPKHTYIVITTEQRQARTPPTHSATLATLESSSPHHNRSVSAAASSPGEDTADSRACSHLFKLSEAVHLYRRAFVRLIAGEICTQRKRKT